MYIEAKSVTTKLAVYLWETPNIFLLNNIHLQKEAFEKIKAVPQRSLN